MQSETYGILSVYPDAHGQVLSTKFNLPNPIQDVQYVDYPTHVPQVMLQSIQIFLIIKQ